MVEGIPQGLGVTRAAQLRPERESRPPVASIAATVSFAATNRTTPEVEESLRERRRADIAAYEARIRADVAAGELPGASADPSRSGTEAG